LVKKRPAVPEKNGIFMEFFEEQGAAFAVNNLQPQYGNRMQFTEWCEILRAFRWGKYKDSVSVPYARAQQSGATPTASYKSEPLRN